MIKKTKDKLIWKDTKPYKAVNNIPALILAVGLQIMFLPFMIVYRITHRRKDE